MSKYEPLWNYVKSQEADFTLTYEQIEKILGFPIDHSFLTFTGIIPIRFLSLCHNMPYTCISFAR